MAKKPAKNANEWAISDGEVTRKDFPPDFIFGVASSAYQVEGAAKEGNRGASIWDAFSHTEGNIVDGSNGDIAVDQYHRYKEDIELISMLGFKAYRFSISWSRIFPDGIGTKVNDEGITYYNNVIDALLEKGIQPWVTLYHWDLPLHLHESMGGWLNKEIVKYFTIYAETCFENFGDRVKNWMTINEPLQSVVNGYCIGIFAPGRSENPSTDTYLAAHHQLLAHASAASLYITKYKEKQGGQIGLGLDCEWAEAWSDKPEDVSAAARRLDFQLGWFLDPIYYGDYPEVMRKKLGARLPQFSEEDKNLLRNSLDYIGLNHYTSRYIAHSTESPDGHEFYQTQEVERIAEWEGDQAIGGKGGSFWLYIVPWGIRKTLNYIAQKYNNPPVYVTENGVDDEEKHSAQLHEMLDDKLRVNYFKDYIAQVAQAIRDGADVRGYFAWSLLDNFQWCQGYAQRFGLIFVDYDNQLSRHPKSSAYWFMNFLKGDKGNNGKEE